MVPYVAAHTWMIHIMGEARHKAISCRDSKYLKKRQSLANDQVAEQRDVKVQRGHPREFCWLSLRQEGVASRDRIQAETNHGLSARSYRVCSFVNKDFVA